MQEKEEEEVEYIEEEEVIKFNLESDEFFFVEVLDIIFFVWWNKELFKQVKGLELGIFDRIFFFVFCD